MTAAIVEIEGVSLKGSNGKPWAHQPSGCDCGIHETYTCDRCGHRVVHCIGCSDNMPGACDFCWREGGAP